MSKILKSVKSQNKELKDAMANQKADEKAAKAAYKEAKVGLFASKDEKLEAARAKRVYEQEKAETAYGKALQQQGKQMQSALSKEAGFFGSDKNISSASRQEANQLVSKTSTFISQNGISSKDKSSKSLDSSTSGIKKVTTKLDEMTDKIIGSVMGTKQSTDRAVPDIVKNIAGDTSKTSGFSL